MFLLSALGVTATAAQAHMHHTQEIDHARELGHLEAEQAERHHSAAMRQQAQHCQEELGQSRRLHHRSMAVALDLARRETMRDVWQQRQFLTQTTVVVATLVLTCVFVAVSQPVLPERLPLWLQYCYTGTIGAALVLLTASIRACFKVQERMAGYAVNDLRRVYTCGRTHANFNSYFSCHCEKVRRFASATFFFGTIAALAASCAVQGITAYESLATAAGDLPIDTSIYSSSNTPSDSDAIAAAAVYAAVLLIAVAGVVALELVASDKTESEADYAGLAGETNEPFQ